MFTESKTIENKNKQNQINLYSKSSLNSVDITHDEGMRMYDDYEYVTVIVTVSPAQSGIPVSWVWTDPDDLATSSIIDPNGSSGSDNRGTCNGIVWHESHTDSNGQARAMLHLPSMYGGDDATVTASLTGVGYFTTGRLVRWRYMYIEYDYMTGPNGTNFKAEDNNLYNIQYAFEGYRSDLSQINWNWCTYTLPVTPDSWNEFSPHQEYTTFSSDTTLYEMHDDNETYDRPIHLLTIDDHDFDYGVYQYAQGIASNNTYSYVYVGRLRDANQTYREKWLLPHEIAHQIGQSHCSSSSQEGFNAGNIQYTNWLSDNCYVKGTGSDVRCMMYQTNPLPMDAQTLARFGEYHVRAIRGITTID